MIDIEETIYETLTDLPNVEHVALDDDLDRIFLIVHTKDGNKEAIVLQKKELIVNALAGIEFHTVDTKQGKLI